MASQLTYSPGLGSGAYVTLLCRPCFREYNAGRNSHIRQSRSHAELSAKRAGGPTPVRPRHKRFSIAKRLGFQGRVRSYFDLSTKKLSSAMIAIPVGAARVAANLSTCRKAMRLPRRPKASSIQKYLGGEWPSGQGGQKAPRSGHNISEVGITGKNCPFDHSPNQASLPCR